MSIILRRTQRRAALGTRYSVLGTRHLSPLVVLGAALLLVAANAAAQDADSQFRWRGRIAAGKAIEIKGVNGNVTASQASGAEVEVTAVKRGRRHEPESVRIDVVEHAGGVTICAVYPTPPRREENECAPGRQGRMNVQNNDVSVHFTVHVPAGVNFIGKTVNGDVEAMRLPADAEAQTVNGSVEVGAAGLASASTVNGSIRANLGRANWSGELEFTTVNGNITLRLPAELNTEVEASTVNGGIESDYPLTVTGRFSPRKLNGTIGSGGRELKLSTVNGEIRLRRGTG